MSPHLKDSRHLCRSKRQRKKLLKQAHLWGAPQAETLLRKGKLNEDALDDALYANGLLPWRYVLSHPENYRATGTVQMLPYDQNGDYDWSSAPKLLLCDEIEITYPGGDKIALHDILAKKGEPPQ